MVPDGPPTSPTYSSFTKRWSCYSLENQMAECVCAGGRAVMLGMSLTLTLACAGNWGHWSERATCQICWLIQKVYFWKDLTHGKHKRQRFSTMDSDRLDQVPLETLTEWIWMKEIEFKNAFKHNSSRQFKCKYHSLLHWNIFFFLCKASSPTLLLLFLQCTNSADQFEPVRNCVDSGYYASMQRIYHIFGYT